MHCNSLVISTPTLSLGSPFFFFFSATLSERVGAIQSPPNLFITKYRNSHPEYITLNPKLLKFNMIKMEYYYLQWPRCRVVLGRVERTVAPNRLPSHCNGNNKEITSIRRSFTCVIKHAITTLVYALSSPIFCCFDNRSGGGGRQNTNWVSHMFGIKVCGMEEQSNIGCISLETRRAKSGHTIGRRA